MLEHRPNTEVTDSVLNALSHVCRRRLLFELYEDVNSKGGESINYTGITQLSPEKEHKHIQLYHVHLPKLDDSEYIEWNKAEKTIQKGPLWEEIEPVLELIDSHRCDLSPLFQETSSDRNGMKR